MQTCRMTLALGASQSSFDKPVVCPLHAASMHLEYPMLFNVTNRQTGRATHCGVLEFIAEEGVIYMPYWVSGMITIGVCDENQLLAWRGFIAAVASLQCRHNLQRTADGS